MLVPVMILISGVPFASLSWLSKEVRSMILISKTKIKLHLWNQAQKYNKFLIYTNK